MAGKSLENYIHEELACPVCLEMLDKPKVLPCQHSFCTKCLQEIVFQSFNKGIRSKYLVLQYYTPFLDVIACPQCRVEHPMIEGDVNRLSTNYTLLNLIDILSRHHDSKSEDTTTTNDENNIQTPEISKSVEHLSLLCTEHKEERVFYCEACELVLCHLCTQTESHKGHNIMSADRARAHLLTEMKRLIAEVETKGNEVETCLSQISNAQLTDDVSVNTCKEEMSSFFDQNISKINAKISYYQEKLVQIKEQQGLLITKLDKLRSSQVKQRDYHVQTLEQSLADITSTLTAARNLHSTNHDNDTDPNRILCQTNEVTKRLKSVADFQGHLFEIPPLQLSFCQNHDPVKTDIIDKNSILVKGLKKAKFGVNTFTISYEQPLACQDPNIQVTVTLPNGKRCDPEEIKVISSGVNSWEVTFYISASSVPFTGLFTSNRVITVAVKINGVDASGSPFSVTCDKLFSKEFFTDLVV